MKLFRLATILIAALALIAAPQAPNSKSSAKRQGSAATGKAAPAETKQAKTPPAGALIDINSASAQELKTLPGIGDALSERIIRNRPYRAKNELVSKKLIPAATYEKIKDRIVAKQK